VSAGEIEETCGMSEIERIGARAGALLLAGLFVWGCASPAAGGDLARSSATRAPGSPAQAESAAAAVDSFGFDLYRRLALNPGNLVFSPASVAIALAMAEPGARGQTATQIDAVLHVSSSAVSADGFNSLDQALAGISGKYGDAEGRVREVKLTIANAPFGQKGWPIEQAYLDTLASRFGAGLRLVDYHNDRARAVKTINSWVKSETEGRIPELLGDLDPLTRLILVNAIYLKAAWQEPFDRQATANADFTRPDGTKVSVPTMSGTIGAVYAAGPGWRAVELPYVGGSMTMTIVVPDDMAAFEKDVDAAAFATITSGMKPATVQLTLPRFKTETKAGLETLLGKMGMPLALDAATADFSGITTAEPLFIGGVVHQANISLDEDGTEAAAATAVVMVAGATPARTDPVVFHVDRPFLFALRDSKTGAILFLGRIGDPSAN
jgi:serine protease inhibitor